MAWNIGAGDAVFVPDFNFFTLAEAIALIPDWIPCRQLSVK